jgi:hypothetical protein
MYMQINTEDRTYLINDGVNYNSVQPAQQVKFINNIANICKCVIQVQFRWFADIVPDLLQDVSAISRSNLRIRIHTRKLHL